MYETVERELFLGQVPGGLEMYLRDNAPWDAHGRDCLASVHRVRVVAHFSRECVYGYVHVGMCTPDRGIVIFHVCMCTCTRVRRLIHLAIWVV